MRPPRAGGITSLDPEIVTNALRKGRPVSDAVTTPAIVPVPMGTWRVVICPPRPDGGGGAPMTI
jgi:hypothetical protein